MLLIASIHPHKSSEISGFLGIYNAINAQASSLHVGGGTHPSHTHTLHTSIDNHIIMHSRATLKMLALTLLWVM